MNRWAFHAALVITLCVAPGAAAQNSTMTIAGTVIDSLTGQPVASVEVYVTEGLSTLSDHGGRFRLGGLPRTQPIVILRRIGYVRRVVNVQVGDSGSRVELGKVWLSPMYFALDTIRVETDMVRDNPRLAQFYERRRSGLGQYLTPQQIWKRNPMVTSDLLRSIAGVTLRCGGGPCVPLTTRFGRTCPMRIMLDGSVVTGTELDMIPPHWIAGIEVYKSDITTPIELGQSRCGVIAVWLGGER